MKKTFGEKLMQKKGGVVDRWGKEEGGGGKMAGMKNEQTKDLVLSDKKKGKEFSERPKQGSEAK